MHTDTPTTILVIDDNPNNLRVATDHLTQYAYRVLTAKDGETGLKRARYTQPCLILLDIGLPGIDGFETCRRLKVQPDTRDIPVLFMTSSTHLQDKQRAFEGGGVDYVTKPFEPRELFARVSAHLTLADQRRQLQQQAAELRRREADSDERYRRESERLEAALAERERLTALAELQAAQLKLLTNRWMGDQASLEHYLSTHLTERIKLVIGELKQAALATEGSPAAANLETALELLHSMLPGAAPPTSDQNPLTQLSAREEQVFRLLVNGRSNKEIASELRLKPTTVSTYRSRITEKLGVEDVPSLVHIALRFPTKQE